MIIDKGCSPDRALGGSDDPEVSPIAGDGGKHHEPFPGEDPFPCDKD